MTGLASRATATLRATERPAARPPATTSGTPCRPAHHGDRGDRTVRARPFAGWSWKRPTCSTTRRSGDASWCDCSSACTCRPPIRPFFIAGNESIWSTSSEVSGNTKKPFRLFCCQPASRGDRSTRSKPSLDASATPMRKTCRPLPTVGAALTTLTKRGLPLVPLCDAPQPAAALQRQIERLGLRGVFQQVLSSFDLGAAKPAAECYAAALAVLDLPAGETAFIGCDRRSLEARRPAACGPSPSIARKRSRLTLDWTASPTSSDLSNFGRILAASRRTDDCSVAPATDQASPANPPFRRTAGGRRGTARLRGPGRPPTSVALRMADLDRDWCHPDGDGSLFPVAMIAIVKAPWHWYRSQNLEGRQSRLHC